MTKKILVLLTAVLISVPCFASPGVTRRLVSHQPVYSNFYSSSARTGNAPAGVFTGVKADYPGVSSTGGYIYSVTLVATAANATLALFDDPINEYGYNSIQDIIVYPIFEISVASSGNSTTISFADPLPTFNGLSISVTNGSAFIESE